MARIIPIENFDNPMLDAYIRLTGAQLRNRLEPEQGIFIAESPTVIDVALQAGCSPISILTEDRLIQSDVQRILDRCPDIPAFTASRELLAELTGFELTRGMLCAMRRPPTPSVAEICRDAKRIAVLENIVDSTNIGAIFRSAAGLGMDAVLLTPSCCDPLCRRALRVSMGTVLLIPWTRIGDEKGDWPHPGLDMLHENGFHTVAMALRKDSLPPDSPKLETYEKLAIILGTEGTGLLPETIEGCGDTVCIPMEHHVDSLNVGAAAAVAFWSMRRKADQE